jgi:hypothetical protein
VRHAVNVPFLEARRHAGLIRSAPFIVRMRASGNPSFGAFAAAFT